MALTASVLLVGCGAVGDRVEGVRSTVSDVTQRARVCAEMVQTFSALDADALEADPEGAIEALRDLADRSPDLVASLQDQLTTLVERIEAVEAGGGNPLADADLRAAARGVASQAVAWCATG